MVVEVMKNNSEYWEKRIANTIWKKYNTIGDKNRALIELYDEAIANIKKELYLVGEKYSKDGVLSRTEMHKLNRLSQLQNKYKKVLEELGENVETHVKNNMFEGFGELYPDICKKIGYEDFTVPHKELMNELLEKPWHGMCFSDRLWENQSKLLHVLNTELTIGLEQGKTVTELAIILQNNMSSGFNQAHRLIRTETMHYLNQAAMKSYKDANLSYVQAWAALDERVCDDCGEYHENVYPINKAPIIPFHPNCRCTYLPVVEKNDTLGKNEDKVIQVHSVGKIDKELYSCIAKNIATDEVVITDERIEHIEQRHAGDYMVISNYFEEALSQPDYILDDGKHKNTGMILKQIQNGDLRMQIIVRVQAVEENNGFKNSIISAWKISETRWNNYLKNKNILYKKE